MGNVMRHKNTNNTHVTITTLKFIVDDENSFTTFEVDKVLTTITEYSLTIVTNINYVYCTSGTSHSVKVYNLLMIFDNVPTFLIEFFYVNANPSLLIKQAHEA